MYTITKNKEEIKEYIREQFPKEACGFILKDDSFIKLENISESPETSFKITSQDFLKYRNEVKFLFHSHTKGDKRNLWDIRTPSFADLTGQQETNIPWAIYGTDGENVLDPIFIPRFPNNSYLGRRFFWHINDCRTLIQDFFHFEFNSDIMTEFNVVDLKEVIENPLYLRNFFQLWKEHEQLEQIYDVKQLRKGDIILMTALPPFGVGTHLGVWTGTRVLHQELFSKENTFNQVASRVNGIYRHPKAKEFL